MSFPKVGQSSTDLPPLLNSKNLACPLLFVLSGYPFFPFQFGMRRTHAHLFQNEQPKLRVYNLPSVNLDAHRQAFSIRKIFFSLRLHAISASGNYERLILQFYAPLFGFFRLIPGFVELD